MAPFAASAVESKQKPLVVVDEARQIVQDRSWREFCRVWELHSHTHQQSLILSKCHVAASSFCFCFVNLTVFLQVRRRSRRREASGIVKPQGAPEKPAVAWFDG
jgi:hypothetical protein